MTSKRFLLILSLLFAFLTTGEARNFTIRNTSEYSGYIYFYSEDTYTQIASVYVGGAGDWQAGLNVDSWRFAADFGSGFFWIGDIYSTTSENPIFALTGSSSDSGPHITDATPSDDPRGDAIQASLDALLLRVDYMITALGTLVGLLLVTIAIQQARP